MKLTAIIKKELLDQMRDKRTIVAAILMPAIIVPLLLFFISEKTSGVDFNKPMRIIISDTENEIKTIILDSFKNAQLTDKGLYPESIIKGEAELMITAAGSGGKYSKVNIYYDSARNDSAYSNARIHDFLKTYFKSPDTAPGGLEIKSMTVRNDKENRTLITLSLILPVFLMVFAASSTMSGVIDMSSGEKERSTIETLLSCNIPGTVIISGKIIAASILGLTSVVSLISGLILFSSLYPEITGGVSLLEFCGMPDIMLVLMLASLAVLFFSSIGMAIGLYARSVKEGTILIIPVIVISSALSTGLVSGDPFHINRLYLFIPVLNFSHLIRSAMFNHHDIISMAVSVTVNLAYTFLFLAISRSLIKKETVIFRS